MKNADVKVGSEYYANVTNKKVVVRIDATNGASGWDATNLSTGKSVRIKTAQRLQGAARKSASAGENKPRSRKRVVKSTSTAGDKKMSCIAAALKVLGESKEHFNAKEMIDAIAEAGYWTSPGGKTPHATLYSAILRDMKKGNL